MKFLGLCGVLLAAGLATGGAKAQEAVAVKELIPTGKLRFGVAFAPKMSALFVVKDLLQVLCCVRTSSWTRSSHLGRSDARRGRLGQITALGARGAVAGATSRPDCGPAG